MGDAKDERAALIVAAAATLAPETEPAQVLDIGHGSTLIVSAQLNYEVTESVQSITPEMAQHQLALAKIEADKQIKVAELTHLAPVKQMVKPLWMAVLVLGGVAAGSLLLGPSYLYVTVAAVGALTISPLVGALAKRIGKGSD